MVSIVCYRERNKMTARIFSIIAALLAMAMLCSATTRTAYCDVEVNRATPDIENQVTGTVSFTQEDEGDVSVTISLSGFDTSDNYTSHGFHVHEMGDIAGGCSGAGGHYNPESVNHAARDAIVRHVGDLGNIIEDTNGEVSTSFTDSVISLTGSYSIMDRAIVVHEEADDLGLGGDSGSLTTGNAGARLACCVIESRSAAIAPNMLLLAALFVVTCLGKKMMIME